MDAAEYSFSSGRRKSLSASGFAVCLALLLVQGDAAAHEVIPSIVDFEVVDDRLTISLQGSLEAFLAEVNLSEVTDVNLTPQSLMYDQKRELSAAELSDDFQAFWPTFLEMFTVTGGGDALPLRLDEISVPEGVPFDLVRISTVTISAELPSAIEVIEFEISGQIGDFVIRQNGVDEPFSGFVEAGSGSQPIDLQRSSLWRSFLGWFGWH